MQDLLKRTKKKPAGGASDAEAVDLGERPDISETLADMAKAEKKASVMERKLAEAQRRRVSDCGCGGGW